MKAARKSTPRRAMLALTGIIVILLAWLTTGSASAATPIIVSEVAPWASGNSPYGADWFELTNTTSVPIDITGWRFDDNSNSFAVSVALTGVTSIAPGRSVVFVEGTPATAAAFITAWFGTSPPAGLQVGIYSGSGIGLSTGGDAVNIYNASGVVQANVTFGASPGFAPFGSFDNAAGLAGVISTLSETGTNGAFVAAGDPNEIGSPGSATVSGGGSSSSSTTAPPGPGFYPWPGSPSVQEADAYVFGGNMSALDYEGTGSAVPGVLWAGRNGPGALFRLVFNGTAWVPDTANGWANGKALRYPDGGDPDTEGVTMVGDSSAGGIYAATERNNGASGISRNSVLRFDVSGTGTTLIATHEWNLTADLPPTGANLGMEAITWVDDSYLTANGFFDETKGHLYNPAEYPGHGTGLFFIGLEGNGTIYAYALDHTGGTFARVATIASGFATVMDLQFDRALKDLWAVCDNTCNGRTTVLRLDPGTGRFTAAFGFERPAGMPNYNNEGFAIAPETYCSGGQKPVFWADDTEDNGHAIRSGTLPCAMITPPALVAEFPIVVLSSVAAFGLLAGTWAIRRRRAPTTVG